jgi:hypothetical protein
MNDEARVPRHVSGSRKGGRSQLTGAAAWALATSVALIALYAGLHSTTLDEAWARPVSRALQAAIAAAAGLALLALRRGGRGVERGDRESPAVRLLILLLAGFSVASPFLHSPRWTCWAIAFGALWLLAAIRELRAGDPSGAD